jgi:hypothetical protein
VQAFGPVLPESLIPEFRRHHTQFALKLEYKATCRHTSIQQDPAQDPYGRWNPSWGDPLSPAPANDPGADTSNNSGNDQRTDQNASSGPNEPQGNEASQNADAGGQSDGQGASGDRNADQNTGSQTNDSDGWDNEAGSGAALWVIIMAAMGTLAAVEWAKQRLQSMEAEGRDPDALDAAAATILGAVGPGGTGLGDVKFPSEDELARRLDISPNEIHDVKNDIMKAFPDELKQLKTTNPDIGYDRSGNIVLRNPDTGQAVCTGVPLGAFGK